MGQRVRSGFLTDEDQGFLFLNVQLPDGASLVRTDEVCRKVDAILAATPEVESFNTIAGYSVLTYSSATYNGFYFVSLKDWAERKGGEHTAEAVMNRLNREFPTEGHEGLVFPFTPPPVAGLGYSSGLS